MNLFNWALRTFLTRALPHDPSEAVRLYRSPSQSRPCRFREGQPDRDPLQGRRWSGTGTWACMQAGEVRDVQGMHAGRRKPGIYRCWLSCGQIDSHANCKSQPKILPLKSITLQKLEEMEVRSRNGGWLESRGVRSMSHGHHAWRRAMRGQVPVVIRMHAPLSPQARVAELQSNKQPASDSGAPF